MQYPRRVCIEHRVICHFIKRGQSDVAGELVKLSLALQWKWDDLDGSGFFVRFLSVAVVIQFLLAVLVLIWVG